MPTKDGEQEEPQKGEGIPPSVLPRFMRGKAAQEEETPDVVVGKTAEERPNHEHNHKRLSDSRRDTRE